LFDNFPYTVGQKKVTDSPSATQWRTPAPERAETDPKAKRFRSSSVIFSFVRSGHALGKKKWETMAYAVRFDIPPGEKKEGGGGESIFKFLRTIQIINWWPVQGKKGKEKSTASPPFVFREKNFAVALLTSYMSSIGIVYRILPPLSFIFNFSMFLITASEFSNV
jgi:hypothetical protein